MGDCLDLVISRGICSFTSYIYIVCNNTFFFFIIICETLYHKIKNFIGCFGDDLRMWFWTTMSILTITFQVEVHTYASEPFQQSYLTSFFI